MQLYLCQDQTCKLDAIDSNLPDSGWSVVCAARAVIMKILKNRLAMVGSRLKDIFRDIVVVACAMRSAHYL